MNAKELSQIHSRFFKITTNGEFPKKKPSQGGRDVVIFNKGTFYGNVRQTFKLGN